MACVDLMAHRLLFGVLLGRVPLLGEIDRVSQVFQAVFFRNHERALLAYVAVAPSLDVFVLHELEVIVHFVQSGIMNWDLGSSGKLRLLPNSNLEVRWYILS